MEKDPNFPDRPDHPDFDILSKNVIKLDDDDTLFPEKVGRRVDLDSLVYMARQRALRMLLMLYNSDRAHDMQVALSTLWIDAFINGCEFAYAKARGGE